jgi:hypothetical protein
MGRVARNVFFPVKFHLETAAYGIADQTQALGWVYLRRQAHTLIACPLVIQPIQPIDQTARDLIDFAESVARDQQRQALLVAVRADDESLDHICRSLGFTALDHDPDAQAVVHLRGALRQAARTTWMVKVLNRQD